MLPVVSGEFRVVADPELKYSPSGTALARVRLVANSRKKNDSGEWVDDKVLWMNATAFGKQAENIAHSIEKGSLVVVTGKIKTDEWTNEAGEKRSAITMNIDDIGLSLRFDGAQKVEAPSKEGAAAAGSGNPWGGDSSAEPPF